MVEVLSFMLSVSLVCWRLAEVSSAASGNSSMRILALFSASERELGIDHRIGRQVLKLALSRAKELHPEMSVELIVHNDETDCSRLNIIPSRVAEHFYFSQAQSSECSARSSSNDRQSIEDVCDSVERSDASDFEETYITGRNSSSLAWSGLPRFKQSVDAIIGPSCDFLVDLVARMASYWQTPIYSASSISGNFARKDIYTTLTRLSPSMDQLAIFISKTLERFNWRHLAFLLDSREVEMEKMERTLNRMRHLWPIKRKLFPVHFKSPAGDQQLNASSSSGTLELPVSSSCTEETRSVLLEAKSVARVFLLLLSDPVEVRRLLLCAHELRMNNGEFVFLGLNLGLRSSKATNSSAILQEMTEQNLARQANNNKHWQAFDWYSAADEHNNLFARQMFESLMVFSAEVPTSDEYNLFLEQTLDMAHQEFPEVRFSRSSVSSLAAALHDSLLLAVEAQCRRVELGPTANTFELDRGDEAQAAAEGQLEGASGSGRARAPLMWNERFLEGLTPNMHINANGDQELDYVLSDLEPEMGQMRPVASFSKQTRQFELLPGTYIHWPAVRARAGPEGSRASSLEASAPTDEPECGFNNDAERCLDRQNLYAALLVLLVLLLLAAGSVAFSHHQYKRIKYQQQLDDYCWKVNWEELQFIQFSDSLASSTPGSVARALRAGASLVSAGTSEEGSMVSISMHSKRRMRPLPSRPLEGLDAEGGRQRSGELEPQSGNSKFGSKLRGTFRKAAPPLIVTSSETILPEEDQQQQEPSTGGQGEAAGSLLAKSRLTEQSGSKENSLLGASSCLIKSDYSSVVRKSMLAMYKSELIIVKQLNGGSLNISRELLVELRSMREHVHDNLAKFVGLCVEPEHLSIMYEYCSRGSLRDMLLNPSIAMDWTLKYSIIGDIVSGLNFIHTTLLDFHGRLKSSNLVLDSRFTVKLTDFGLQNLYSQLEPIEYASESEQGEEEELEGEEDSKFRKSQVRRQHDQLSLSVSQAAYNMESVSMRGENIYRAPGQASNKWARPRQLSSGARRAGRLQMENQASARFFWTAPEHLRDKNVHFAGSKRGDVYSLAIILFEIFTRKEPYFYGTSAKPHWPSIKPERGKLAGSAAAENQRRFSRETGNSKSIVGSSARRAASKIRQAQSTVAPQPTGVEEAGSVISAHSLATTHQSNPEALVEAGQAAGAKSRSSRLSASAIEEQEEEEPLSGEGEASSGARAGPARRISQDDCKSQRAGSKEQQEAKMMDAEEILDQLRMGLQPEPVRPYVPNYVLHEVSPKLIELMRICWSESPSLRPNLQQVRSMLRKITKGVASKNYLDNLLERLQNYAADLERIVDGKSYDIMEEKCRAEGLLYQLVPKFVADKLKRQEPIIPQLFDGVTIFFSDIIGFEKYAAVMNPSELVDLLNSIYSSFESIISSFDVTKIETVIDQFLVASGISLQHELESSGASRQQQAGQAGEPNGPELADNKPEAGQRERSSRSRRTKFRAANLLKESIRRGQDSKSAPSRQPTGDSIDSQATLPGANSDQQAPALPPAGQSMRSSGLDLNHYKRSSAEQIARMALCIRDLVKSFHFRQSLSSNFASTDKSSAPSGAELDQKQFVASSFNVRIGIHSGTVCAGIVGLKRPKFCLIGDTVNVASRMHTNSKANKIQISDDTRQLLEQVPGLSIEPRGKIEVKGKGLMDTYWLESSY